MYRHEDENSLMKYYTCNYQHKCYCNTPTHIYCMYICIYIYTQTHKLEALTLKKHGHLTLLASSLLFRRCRPGFGQVQFVGCGSLWQLGSLQWWCRILGGSCATWKSFSAQKSLVCTKFVCNIGFESGTLNS